MLSQNRELSPSGLEEIHVLCRSERLAVSKTLIGRTGCFLVRGAVVNSLGELLILPHVKIVRERNVWVASLMIASFNKKSVELGYLEQLLGFKGKVAKSLIDHLIAKTKGVFDLLIIGGLRYKARVIFLIAKWANEALSGPLEKLVGLLKQSYNLVLESVGLYFIDAIGQLIAAGGLFECGGGFDELGCQSLNLRELVKKLWDYSLVFPMQLLHSLLLSLEFPLLINSEHIHLRAAVIWAKTADRVLIWQVLCLRAQTIWFKQIKLALNLRLLLVYCLIKIELFLTSLLFSYFQ